MIDGIHAYRLRMLTCGFCGVLLVFLWSGCDSSADAIPAVWEIPARSPDARSASELIERWSALPLESRDEQVVAEILAGNVPSWLRSLSSLTTERPDGGDWISLEFRVLPDYLAVGSDDDFLFMPMSPQAAQRIADATDMTLPTALLVDLIHSMADRKVAPRPIPPSDAMTTLPVFAQHTGMLLAQRDSLGIESGSWVAGHKKDIVLTGRLNDLEGRVAIYGWHQVDGSPIQPLYTGHTDRWVDYSHGVRLVARSVLVNGKEEDIRLLLESSARSKWLLTDGPMIQAAYPTAF